jgi:hypothetical protein
MELEWLNDQLRSVLKLQGPANRAANGHLFLDPPQRRGAIVAFGLVTDSSLVLASA